MKVKQIAREKRRGHIWCSK